jgi:hypothetical protein
MDPAPGVLPATTENPAAAADAEQHAREEIAGLRARMEALVRAHARPLVATAGVAAVSGWLIRRWRRGR